MRRMRTLALCLALAFCLPAHPRIERSAAEVAAFKRENPCPSTGRRRGSCPGWHVDHITALCMGGEDQRGNMHWLSEDDHRFKTAVDIRECRRLKKRAHTPVLP